MTRNKRAALAVVVLALAGSIAALAAFSAPTRATALPTPHPTVDTYQLVSTGQTPPTAADCIALGITCFSPQAIQSAYNVGPLYAHGWDGRGMTIAIVDAYSSNTMAHDLHVFVSRCHSAGLRRRIGSQ